MATSDPVPTISKDPIQYAQTLSQYLDPQLSVLIWIHLSGAVAKDDMETKTFILNQLWDIVKSGPRLNLANAVAQQFTALGLTPPNLSDVEEAHRISKESITNPSEEMSRLLDVLGSEEIQAKLRPADRAFNANHIATASQVPVENLYQIYDFAQLNYNVGNTKEASKLLEQYLNICTDTSRYLATLWGLLAAYILSGDYVEALDLVFKLSEAIESTTFSSPSHSLQQRCWLLHWSLFPFFNLTHGLDRLLELFLQPLYLNAIETQCPWILRYLIISSAITGKNTTEIAKSANQQKYHLKKDPFASFFEALLVEVDFYKVSDAIKDIEKVIPEDIFLCPIYDFILFSIKKLVFNELVSLYTRLPMDKLAYYLGEPDANFDLTNLLNPDQDVQYLEDEGVLIFPREPESRREILEKLDRISHFSSDIMATLYKNK